ncbi:MAG: UDP-N-acetylmuramoylalanine-D-glutamate ligase [candidate division TM6 bacterium GW2011_GWF2_43_17]|nr:MAG: UDP-N-acetylmuramoylalanine-D-glutamate ligase [candidate division TM6 bacterium GW2011_GWF2_43_17]HAU30416.1 UDP-N-acetylmuramoyl-L-alanine--D-glutamate ligase [Candidatus Dependentiae bacterium]
MVTLSRSSLNSKKIGIWGLGVSGQKLLNFLAPRTESIAILEKPNIFVSHAPILAQYSHQCFKDPDERSQFFNACDIIIPSPGIAVDASLLQTGKVHSELDLFALFNQKTTIAITGSLGKTSITTLLARLLDEPEYIAITGGNIGNGIIESIQSPANCLVLELSSFQLEYTQQFFPDIAIITNIYENHLDRHKTLENYIQAKLNIIRNQKAGQYAIIPATLAEQYDFIMPTKGTLVLCGKTKLDTPDAMVQICTEADGSIILRQHGKSRTLLPACQVSQISFPQNWVIIAAALHCLNKVDCITQGGLQLPEHRMEDLGEYNGIRYINDSKSTVMQATLAALQRYSPKSTIVLLGGLSKGVDRTQLIPLLAGVAHVACFGHEAPLLLAACQTHGISSSQHDTLDAALAHAQSHAQIGATILFSPGGSSYDLFESYQARGAYFKQLVLSR